MLLSVPRSTSTNSQNTIIQADTRAFWTAAFVTSLVRLMMYKVGNRNFTLQQINWKIKCSTSFNAWAEHSDLCFSSNSSARKFLNLSLIYGKHNMCIYQIYYSSTLQHIVVLCVGQAEGKVCNAHNIACENSRKRESVVREYNEWLLHYDYTAASGSPM